MKPVAISAFTATTALGAGCDALLQGLRTGRSGLQKRVFETAVLDTWIGEVEGLDQVQLPRELAEFDSRNNRLAWLGLQGDSFADAVEQLRERRGARRIGVFLGTSTSGMLETEVAYRQREPATGALPADLHYASTHNTFSVAAFVRAAFGLRGPAFVISTACSSSAKVFATASRLLELGVIDGALVGGVDSLCLTTLYGFHALELLSPDICRPWDLQRRGLSIGEGAAFALLQRQSDAPQALAWLRGVGETSDGFHMSSPLPDGAGAAAAMRLALEGAGLQPSDVGYINLHGTATPGNDAAESRAVAAVFGAEVPCSSTKGATGHTLGAAGAVEAAVALLALRHGFIPAGLNLQRRDPTLAGDYRTAVPGDSQPLRHVASNSFGFGGSNACLVFGAAP